MIYTPTLTGMFHLVAQDCNTRVVVGSVTMISCQFEAEPYGEKALLELGSKLVNEKGYKWCGDIIALENTDDSLSYQYLHLLRVMPNNKTYHVKIFHGGRVYIEYASD